MASTAVQLQPNEKTPQLDPDVTYGDFRDVLARHGFAVVHGVLSQEKCDAYIHRMYTWLESFGLGYKRDDPSTWSEDKLPVSHKGGLYNNYGVAHEQFLWDLRSEPELAKAFEIVWNTDELMVGYDGCNISLPFMVKQGDYAGKPWPHVDQSPLRKHLHCIQGIINLYENGPEDGGLMVLKGSRHVYEEFFQVFEKDKPAKGWTTDDTHIFTDEQIAWLESRPGAEWHKVCARPGDVILWDSRLCHYGTPPKGTNPRIAAYICYKPASLINPEQLAYKRKLYEQMSNTTHDGTLPHPAKQPVPVRRGYDVDPAYFVRKVPDKRPVLSKRGRQLAGLEAY